MLNVIMLSVVGVKTPFAHFNNILRRHDTQHDNTQHDNTQHDNTQHDNTQYIDTQHYELNCDTQQK
jgi:hypothetical protein